MVLALRAGNLDQVIVGELRRAGEDRSGDCDLVVTRQSMDDATRRVVDWRKFGPKFGERVGFHLLDQVREHVVKDADLLGIKTLGVAKKKIGHPPEDFGAAPIAGACGEDGFEFVDNGRGLRHFLSWAGFFPPPFTDCRGSLPTRRRTIRAGRKAKVKSARTSPALKNFMF